MQRGPGVIPNGGQGALGRDRISRNDRGRIPGNQNSYVFLGRSRGFPAQAGVPDIRRQPHTQPHCLALGSWFQSQSATPFPYSPQNYNTPPSHPNLFSSQPPNPCPCNNICPCHGLPPTPPPSYADKLKSSSESEDSDEPLPYLYKSFNTTPYTSYFAFILFSIVLTYTCLNCYPVSLEKKKKKKRNDEAMTKSDGMVP